LLKRTVKTTHIPNPLPANRLFTSKPDGGLRIGFRLYGPLEAHFDKSWPLPDIELVK